MLQQMTLWDTPNAISSPASVDGHSPLASQAGPMTASCGPARVRASRSASPAKAPAPTMSGICGPTSFACFVPDGPLSGWESRLRQRLARIGSTECFLTWKASVTPAGRPLSRLVPSMGRTVEIDYGSSLTEIALWATPTSLAPEKNGNNEAGNSAGLVSIRAHAMAALWATLTVAQPGGSPDAFLARKAALNGACGVSLTDLRMQAQVACWPTPTAKLGDPRRGSPSHAVGVARLESGRSNLDDAAAAHGLAPAGSSATTEKPGALAPEFVAWLMGFPPEWLDCAPETMPRKAKSK